MAKQSFQVDPDTDTVDVDTFNEHKHIVDMTIKLKAHDAPSEQRETSAPVV